MVNRKTNKKKKYTNWVQPNFISPLCKLI